MGSRVFIKKGGGTESQKIYENSCSFALSRRQSGKIQNDYVIILNYPALEFPHSQDNRVGISKNTVVRYHIFLNIYH